jgi:hypothetical protein
MSVAGGLGFIIIALAVLFVIFLFVVLYRLAYQQNANRALRDGHSTRLIEPVPFLQIIALGVLLILGFTTHSVIQSMETRLMVLQEELRTIKNQVLWMGNTIGDLEDQVNAANQLQSWVQFSAVTLEEVDVAQNEAVFRMIVTLKDLPADATVFFIASNTNDALDIIQTEVTSFSLRYDTEITVDLDGSYVFGIFMESPSGNQHAEIDQIDIPELIDDLFHFDLGGHGNDTSITWEIDARIDQFAIEALHITSVLIQIYHGETLLQSNEVFGDGQVINGSWVFSMEYQSMAIPGEEIVVQIDVTSDLGIKTIRFPF